MPAEVVPVTSQSSSTARAASILGDISGTPTDNCVYIYAGDTAPCKASWKEKSICCANSSRSVVLLDGGYIQYLVLTLDSCRRANERHPPFFRMQARLHHRIRCLFHPTRSGLLHIRKTGIQGWVVVVVVMSVHGDPRYHPVLDTVLRGNCGDPPLWSVWM